MGATRTPSSQSQAAAILAIVESYRLNASLVHPESRDTFLALIQRAVEQGRPVPFALPAFPFKSPNTADKVLGVLPDKAEEISLLHLQGLCNNVRNVYAPGAELTIVSDGIVYNDLLGVADKTVWAYGEQLREMAAQLSCTSLRFARLSTMLEGKGELPEYDDAASYERAAPVVRETLLKAYVEQGYDVSADISQDESVRMTYRGYLKYLATDLADSDADGASNCSSASDASSSSRSRKAFRRHISAVAKQMIARGKVREVLGSGTRLLTDLHPHPHQCYAACVKEVFPDAVRLSIHAGSSAAKLPIAVLPNVADRPVTPWHCVMTCSLNGALVPMSRAEAAARDDLEIVRKADGQAWCFRERSPLYNAFTSAGAAVEHTYPCGLRVEFPRDTPFARLDIRAARALADHNSPVVLRGLDGSTDRDAFLAKGREMGAIMKWTFGELLEVKEVPADAPGFNISLSAEAMPFHYDGVFKVVDGAPAPPHYQLFVAVEPGPAGEGHTLFASSPRLFEHLRIPLADFRRHTWRARTASFGGADLGGLPLVVPHPVTGVPCLRYHEDWPSARTRFQEIRVDIEGVDDKTDATIRATLDHALYDWRVCLRGAWQKGDVLVNDNILTLHTREAYLSNVGRELWRLHVD